jgi:hypothetical protein
MSLISTIFMPMNLVKQLYNLVLLLLMLLGAANLANAQVSNGQGIKPLEGVVPSRSVDAPLNGTLSIQDQKELYDGCVPSCSTEAGLDQSRPFISEAYCSCFCSRIAVKITSLQINAADKNGMSDPVVAELISKVAKICLEAVK